MFFFCGVLGACFRFALSRARFLRRFHVKFKLRRHVVMQLDCDFVFAAVLDGAVEKDSVPINLLAELALQSVHDVLRGDRPERFAGFAGGQRKGDV